MMMQINGAVIAKKSLRCPVRPLRTNGEWPAGRAVTKKFFVRGRLPDIIHELKNTTHLWPSFENEEKKGQTVTDDHSSGRGPSILQTIDSSMNAGIIALATLRKHDGIVSQPIK
jgi:hypothetical protein